MAKLNLDAIIPREDFESIGENKTHKTFNELPIVQLDNILFLPYLRKPDFQRETNEWDAKKIYEFLDSFINGDLIPSIILWRSSSGFYFVIDVAHRLSALIAWIKDDYGDGELSMKFFDGQINEEQKRIADEARKLINKKIGSYLDIVRSHETGNEELINKAKNIGYYSLNLQWVSGDAKKAEHSFFKINQQGVPVNNTEIKLLESRKKGNCIATRAIKSGGKGHNYWADFSADNQNIIQSLSEEIFSSLFNPPLKTPIKSPDLPIAGKIVSAQTLPLILDFINITNNIPSEFKEKIQEDISGDETIKYLRNARKIVWRINSMHSSSLGLHPIVYFYSLEGKHKPASFYSITQLIMELEKKNEFNSFIKIREKFEHFLLEFNYLTQQINEKHKYSIKSYKHICDFYLNIIKLMNDGLNNREIIDRLTNTTSVFKYLKIEKSNSENQANKNFTTETKSAIFIKEALSNPIKCKLCNGLIHQNSITIDHVTRAREGGLGEIANGQLAHPYCNTTFKN